MARVPWQAARSSIRSAMVALSWAHWLTISCLKWHKGLPHLSVSHQEISSQDRRHCSVRKTQWKAVTVKITSLQQWWAPRHYSSPVSYLEWTILLVKRIGTMRIFQISSSNLHKEVLYLEIQMLRETFKDLTSLVEITVWLTLVHKAQLEETNLQTRYAYWVETHHWLISIQISQTMWKIWTSSNSSNLNTKYC